MKRINPEQPRNYSIIKNAGKFMDMVIAILYLDSLFAKMAQQSRDHIM